MKRKRRWMLPAAAGFLVLYLAVMLACTFLVYKKYMEEFWRNCYNVFTDVYEQAAKLEEGSAWSKTDQENYYQSILSRDFLNEKYQQLSFAFYDGETKAAVRTEDVLTATTYYRLVDYKESAESAMLKPVLALGKDGPMEEEDLARLAGYERENRKALLQDMPAQYRYIGRISRRGEQICGLMVQKITWDTDKDAKPQADPYTGSQYSFINLEDLEYVQTGSEIIWEWENPQADQEGIQYVSMEFSPRYLTQGYHQWKRWKNSEFLQELTPENMEAYYQELEEQGGINYGEFTRNYKLESRVEIGGKTCYLTLASECRPWLAAADYMKFVYLAGFLLTVVCMGTALLVFERSERQRIRLEENRRDLTNAMAHKMKTPLGIIRGCAENLQENTVEEKREYYLQQIIGQTEEMDAVVAEMVNAMRLDSENPALQKERILVWELMEKQLQRLTPLAKARRITVQMEKNASFEVEGDMKYLEKAFWNLLDNALRYSKEGSTLYITVRQNSCRLENQWTGDSYEEGMGLYLTEKILKMHGIRMQIDCSQGTFTVTCTAEGK